MTYREHELDCPGDSSSPSTKCEGCARWAERCEAVCRLAPGVVRAGKVLVPHQFAGEVPINPINFHSAAQYLLRWWGSVIADLECMDPEMNADWRQAAVMLDFAARRFALGEQLRREKAKAKREARAQRRYLRLVAEDAQILDRRCQ